MMLCCYLSIKIITHQKSIGKSARKIGNNQSITQQKKIKKIRKSQIVIFRSSYFGRLYLNIKAVVAMSNQGSKLIENRHNKEPCDD